MAEKGTPHTRLHIVKAMVEEGKCRLTFIASQGATELGFASGAEVFEVIKALTTADFYKSMTAYDDHTTWHEVYRPTYNGQKIYLKFIVKDDVLIVSFKEL